MSNTNVLRERPLMLIVLSMLLVSSFAASSAYQPPIVMNTYYMGTVGQPRRLDPARAYDTLSCELIQNVYEPLVFFSDKDLVPEPEPLIRSSNVSDSALWANLAQFEPILATAMPTISPDGKEWTFTINTNALFPSWTKGDGTVSPPTNLTVRDVEYSFERMLIQDMFGSPSWMISLPAFGTLFNFAPVGTWDMTSASDRATAATAIDGFVTTVGNIVTLHFSYAWSETIIMQILSQTWSGIGQEAFCVEHGCWNGSYYDVGSGMGYNWAHDYVRKPSNSYSPLDLFYANKTKYTAGVIYNSPASPGDVPAMLGTGPYKFTSWDKVNKIWRIDWNPNYWRFWTNAGDGAGNFLLTIIKSGSDPHWKTREMKFLSGEYDEISVPLSDMSDLLLPGQDFEPVEGVNLYYGHASLENVMMVFQFAVDSASPYNSKINGTVCSDFFSNRYVRSAFTYALNYTEYIREAWYGEALQCDSWWVEGLQPSNFKNTALTHKNVNTTRIQEDLEQAYFPAVSNTSSVWDMGFQVYLPYDLGNDQRRIACEMIASVFAGLPGGASKYSVIPVGFESEWLYDPDLLEEYYLPVFFAGWLADFADPENFARPYMHSQGDWAYLQQYSNATVDALIGSSLLMPNNATREANYKELQREYYDAAIGLPLVQPTERRWVKDWVKGWYYNQLYAGYYYYDQVYKISGTVENVNVAVESITPIVFYNEVMYYNGQMVIGNGNGNPATMIFTVGVARNDVDAPASVDVVVGLKVTNNTHYYYIDVTTTQLAPGGMALMTLTWNGTDPGPVSLGTWTVSAEAQVVSSNCRDTDEINNVLPDGTVTLFPPSTGDINKDGIVDIFDAIALANAFGSKVGNVNYNEEADLDSSGEIDIFDAIILANDFNERVP